MLKFFNESVRDRRKLMMGTVADFCEKSIITNYNFCLFFLENFISHQF